MRWIFELQTEEDPIVACRLLNALRRKGVRILRLNMAAESDQFTISALVELANENADHTYHFLRRMEGVHQVNYRAAESSGESAGRSAGLNATF